MGEAPKSSGPHPLVGAVAVALLAALLASAKAAGLRDGDFVHLWLGGNALVEVGSSALYDAETHRTLMSADFDGSPRETLWAARNDALGAFFYPPPAGLFYAPFGALPVHTAGMVHAVLAALGVALAGVLIGGATRLGRVAGVALVLSTPALLHNHVL